MLAVLFHTANLVENTQTKCNVFLPLCTVATVVTSVVKYWDGSFWMCFISFPYL